MEIEDKIIDLLKEKDLNILESIEVLRIIEDAFLKQLNLNLNSANKPKTK